jgi:uncharacterized protein YqjF (DUF2071 family)
VLSQLFSSKNPADTDGNGDSSSPTPLERLQPERFGFFGTESKTSEENHGNKPETRHDSKE